MAAAQLMNIGKELFGAKGEFIGIVKGPRPDVKKVLASIKQVATTQKAMSLDDVLLLNHALFFIIGACALLTALIDSITAILSASPPPLVSSLISIVSSVTAALLQSYVLWFLAAKKKGDGFPGPLIIFGPWWLFCLGVALALQGVMGIIGIVLTAMSIIGVPSLQTVSLAGSLVTSLVEVTCYSSMAYGLLVNNKAYDVSHLLSRSKSDAKRGRDAEKTGAKKRSETPTPTAKKD